jgi:signal transduction histidine kinase
LRFLNDVRGSSIYYHGVVTPSLRNWLTALIGGGVTILAVVAPDTLLNQRAPVARAILETTTALVGTLVALLVVGRYRRSRNTSDLFIVFGVLLLAWVHPLFVSVPDLINPNSVGNGYSERVEMWGSALVRFVAAVYLVFATLRPEPWPVKVWRSRGPLFAYVTPAALILVAIVLLAWRVPVDYGGLLKVSRLPQAALSWFQVVGSLTFLVAFRRLTGKARDESDPFISWLATGCLLGTFAMISYAMLPDRGVQWLQPGDLLRAAAVCAWAAGVVTEIRSYWSKIAEAAKRESLRSVALDLHDGIAQELALITSYLHASTSVRDDPEWHKELLSTAERALAETRRTISALATGETPPIETELKETAVLASGGSAKIDVEVEDMSVFSGAEPMQRESIIRIVREAVVNAVQHGHADQVTVVFAQADGTPSLRVIDDGIGFDPANAVTSERFGLVSMRERAEALGASFDIQSAPGHGTTVEVLWK